MVRAVTVLSGNLSLSPSTHARIACSPRGLMANNLVVTDLSQRCTVRSKPSPPTSPNSSAGDIVLNRRTWASKQKSCYRVNKPVRVAVYEKSRSALAAS